MKNFLGLLLFVALSASVFGDGQISIRVLDAKTKQGQDFARGFRKNRKSFDKFAQALNRTFVLPRDLPILFTELGVENAFYDPSKHRILVSYELMGSWIKLFKPIARDPKELSQMVAGATVFTIFHELGHALIGELKLASTGREEDAVDEFATILLAQSDAGQQAALGAAQWFESMGAQTKKISKARFFDEHSFDRQRLGTILGLLYASNPDRYRKLCLKQGITPRTLARSQRDYAKKVNAWKTLLQPHLEPGAKIL